MLHVINWLSAPSVYHRPFVMLHYRTIDYRIMVPQDSICSFRDTLLLGSVLYLTGCCHRPLSALLKMFIRDTLRLLIIVLDGSRHSPYLFDTWSECVVSDGMLYVIVRYLVSCNQPLSPHLGAILCVMLHCDYWLLLHRWLLKIPSYRYLCYQSVLYLTDVLWSSSVVCAPLSVSLSTIRDVLRLLDIVLDGSSRFHLLFRYSAIRGVVSGRDVLYVIVRYLVTSSLSPQTFWCHLMRDAALRPLIIILDGSPQDSSRLSIPAIRGCI
jgi:hypothetical protein